MGWFLPNRLRPSCFLHEPWTPADQSSVRGVHCGSSGRQFRAADSELSPRRRGLSGWVRGARRSKWEAFETTLRRGLRTDWVGGQSAALNYPPS